MSTKLLVGVTIPIYKVVPTPNEELSFIQCLKVLKAYPIVIVCPSNLNLIHYQTIANEYNIALNIEYFDPHFFENIAGYNKLMLSIGFYKRFKTYKFILIYQLDAWVFKDELEYWCNQEYDYIGAPWFENFQQGNLNITETGNGGFSLRKVETAIKILKSHRRIVPLREIIRNELRINYNYRGRIKSLITIVKSILFLNNNTHHRFNDFDKNEDYFWSSVVVKRFKNYKIPLPHEASKFSFELNPSYLFKLNNNKLPFGCHAWEKYEPEFWKQFIKAK